MLIKSPENHLEVLGYRKHPLNSMTFGVAEKVTNIHPLNSMDFGGYRKVYRKQVYKRAW